MRQKRGSLSVLEKKLHKFVDEIDPWNWDLKKNGTDFESSELRKKALVEIASTLLDFMVKHEVFL